MKVELVPLVELQRELYAMQRGRERFEQYRRAILNERRDDVALAPLVAINPMARDHVAAILDELLAMGAEALARQALEDAAPRWAEAPGEFKLGVVVVDDARGGWTNRFDFEYRLRFAVEATEKRGWLSAVLWSSEAPRERAVRWAAMTAALRVAWRARHGQPRTLAEMLRQEGAVLTAAGCTEPILDAEDLAYTREAIAPFLRAGGKRLAVECLFGDAAARSLGFEPRGLSPWAGLALALHDARRE